MATEDLTRLIERLSVQRAPASHLDRLRALRALCERTPGCVGLALVGSYAQNLGDRISDLDLVALCSDNAAERFLAEAHQLLSKQDVLTAFSGAFGTEGSFWKYIFLDFSSCELYALDLPTGFRLRRPYVAVWDPIDLLATLESDEPPPKHEDFDAYQHGDDGLLWELFDCIKWLKRGRKELAKNHLRKLVDKLSG